MIELAVSVSQHAGIPIRPPKALEWPASREHSVSPSAAAAALNDDPRSQTGRFHHEEVL